MASVDCPEHIAPRKREEYNPYAPLTPRSFGQGDFALNAPDPEFMALLSLFLAHRGLNTLPRDVLGPLSLWFERMASDDPWACVAYALMLEAMSSKHPRVAATLRQFLTDIAHEASPLDLAPISSMLRVLDLAYWHTPSPPSAHGYYFLGQFLHGPQAVVRLTTDGWLKEALMPFVADKVLGSRLRSQATRGLLDPYLRKAASRDPHWFVTREDEFVAVFNSTSPASRPIELRNQAGLYHLLGYHGPLIAIYYTIDTARLFSPTAFDAQGYPVFRPSTSPGWGAAMNLATLAVGLPEAVHEACPLGPAATFGLWLDLDGSQDQPFDFARQKREYSNLVRNALQSDPIDA